MTDPRRSLRRRNRKQSTARRPRRGRTMMPEQLEQRQLLAVAGLHGLLASQASPYQNPFIAQDVDVNGEITPA